MLDEEYKTEINDGEESTNEQDDLEDDYSDEDDSLE
jgi:hypothetical protein